MNSPEVIRFGFVYPLLSIYRTEMIPFKRVSNRLLQPARVFAISNTKISVAPTLDNSSIAVAIFFFSTIELTATQPSSSKALMVGALFPGVILLASLRLERLTLYWQRTYFCAAIECQS